MTPPARSVFGFSIDSPLRFSFLREGTGLDVLHIDEAPGETLAHAGTPIARWNFKEPGGGVASALYRQDGVYHFWTADAAWFRIDPRARTITVSAEADETRRELRLWGVPTTLCSTERGDLSLHAAAVEIDGGAVLFAAPGQHGKTTLALACHARGYRVLTEDVSCCRFEPGPLLYPGPAALRIRPDMYQGQAPAGTHIGSIKPDRIFLGVDGERRGTAAPLPIRGIFLLRQSDDEVRLERADVLRSLPDLWALSFRVPGGTPAAGLFERVSRLADSAGIWNLHRPLRRDMLEAVVSRIAETPLLSPN